MPAEQLCHLQLGGLQPVGCLARGRRLEFIQCSNLAGPADRFEHQRGTRRHQSGGIAALHAVNGGQGQPDLGVTGAALHDALQICSNWIPIGIHMDGMTSSKVLEPRPRAGETEKMTVNVGVVDLGHVDLLVQEGFYSNRSDLVRTALRNQLALHADTVKQTVARRTLTVGLQHFSRADLERAVAAGRRLQVQVVGLARIADDVSPELARAVIESVTVLGAFQASAAVRQALADRIH